MNVLGGPERAEEAPEDNPVPVVLAGEVGAAFGMIVVDDEP